MRAQIISTFRLLMTSAALAVFLSSTGCGNNDEAEAQRAASEHRVRAESYLRQGQLRAALIELQNAEQALPGRVETLSLMGQAFYALGALDKALAVYEKLEQADKLDAESQAGYARTLLRLGRFGRAQQLLDNAATPLLQGLQSQALLGQGERVEAGEVADSVLQSRPDQIDALVTQANVRYLDGDMTGLQASLDALAELDSARAWLWRARLEQAQDKQDEAITSLSRALDHLNEQDVMTADRFEALRRMMNALIAEGRTEDAMGYSGILAGSAAGQMASQYDTAVSKIREGSLDEATALFEEILSQSPGHQGSAMALGLIAFQQQDYQRAQQYLSTAVERGSSSVTAMKYLISVLLQEGNTEAALTKLDEAQAAFPQDPDLKALKGLALQRSGASDDAAALFEEVLEEQPGNVGAHISLGQIALEKGDLERAERFFRQALAIVPNAASALTGLVEVADARGLRSVGMAELRQQATAENDAQLWVLAAVTSLKYQDHQSARDDAAKALALEPGQPRARAILGALNYMDARRAFAAQQYSQAESMAKQALTYLPDHLGLTLLQASAASAGGDTEGALQVARDMQSRSPALHHGFELEGDIYSQQGATEQAIEAYAEAWDRQKNPVLATKYTAALSSAGEDALAVIRQWTEAAPDNAQAWLVLAGQAEAADDRAQAIDAYEQANQLAPDNAAILNNLAWQYHLGDDPRAESLAAQAYTLAPDNAAIADTYGWILHQLGQHQRAVTLLAQAAEQAPDNAEIQAHLEAARAAAQ